jgi:transposase-like protein
MPWKETDPMTERLRFITPYLSQVDAMTELCERFGIRRNTGDKWVRRSIEQGLAGLQEKSRAPLASSSGARGSAKRAHAAVGTGTQAPAPSRLRDRRPSARRTSRASSALAMAATATP